MTQQLSAAERKQTLIGLLIGAVLAVPFAAAGLGILLFMTAPMVYDWARMQTWHSVPAQVESAALQSQKSSKGSTRRPRSRNMFAPDHQPPRNFSQVRFDCG